MTTEAPVPVRPLAEVIIVPEPARERSEGFRGQDGQMHYMYHPEPWTVPTTSSPRRQARKNAA